MALFGRTSERDEQKAIAYRDWLQQRNPLSIASLVLGVFSLVELGALVVPGVASIALGIMSLLQLRRENTARPRGHGLAYGGIILSVLSLIIAGFLYLPRVRG
jgi:maltodextrin utilization protein YvdJ